MLAIMWYAVTPPTLPSVLRAVLGNMQFTLHATRRTPHGASRLVQAMPAWLVITRHAPSQHSRDARVYGHTTAAMHKLSTPPPLPPPERLLFIKLSLLCGSPGDDTPVSELFATYAGQTGCTPRGPLFCYILLRTTSILLLTSSLVVPREHKKKNLPTLLS